MKKTLLALLLFIPFGFAQEGSDIGMIVNNQIISRGEMMSQFAQYRAGAPSQVPDAVILEQLTEELIKRELLTEMAKQFGLGVSEDEINRAVAMVAGQNSLSQEALYQKVHRETGLNQVEYRNRLALDVIEEKLKHGLLGSEIQVRDAEIDDALTQFALEQDATLEVEDLLLPLPDGSAEERASVIKELLAQVSQALQQGSGDLNAVVQALPNARYNRLGQLSVRQIPPRFASVLMNLPTGEISANPVIDADGMHFLRVVSRDYKMGNAQTVEAEVKHILIKGKDDASKKAILNIQSALKQGADFAEMAKRFSHDTASAINGGSLGRMRSEEVVPEFAKMMANIPLNTLSEPFQTEFGWHILMVSQRQMVNRDEALLRQNIANTLFGRQLEEKWQSELQKIRDSAYIENRLK